MCYGRRVILARGALLVALLLVACGARSGLDTDPPLARLDAGPDASRPPDAFGPPDALGPPDAFRPPDAFHPPDARRCSTDSECDDSLGCTLDRCERGGCTAMPIDARCDDGLFCNGEERCVPEIGCTATPPSCADAVACTLDSCDETLRACVQLPDEALCPISHRCDSIRGCIARALAHDATTLYEIDLPSGELRVLGRTSETLTDLALHPDGTLYGAVTGALGIVEYRAPRFTRIVDIGGAFNALDVAPDGTLYGATDARVVRFDLAGGRVTDVASFPRGLATSGDLAFVEGRLYGSARGMRADDVLVAFDLVSGAGRSIGGIGHACVWGLAPFGTTLYGLTCEGKLLSIDIATGRGALLSMGRAMFYGAGAR